MNCNAEFLKTGPCNISYKGELIGVTLDSPLLNFEPDFYEAKCNKIEAMTIHKIITNMKTTVSVDIKEVNNAFANFCDANGNIINVVFGEDVLTTGGVLCLSPISKDDSHFYCFPKAVLIPEAISTYKKTKNYCLKIIFEVYEDLEGVLVEKHSK